MDISKACPLEKQAFKLTEKPSASTNILDFRQQKHHPFCQQKYQHISAETTMFLLVETQASETPKLFPAEG